VKPNETLTDIETPFGLDPAQIERILKSAGATTDLAERIERISESFLGRSYVEGSLGGGPDLPEEFSVSLEAFDCVTYIEIVLALVLAGTTEEFINRLREIRYEGGRVDWFHRNHYMTDWARNNEQRGFIANVTTGTANFEKTCTLSLIPGLPVRAATFHYVPNRSLAEVAGQVDTGDLILFVSTRETLDVFHAGLLVKRDAQILLRHATRTANAVIEQDLGEFMSKNEMEGFVLLRPLCRR
jgi:Protein of unknown function (DUF1460)